LSDNDEQSALELEVNEEGNVVGTLFTLGQFGKDEEAPPALTSLCDAHTLPDGSHGFEVAFRHTSRLDDAYGSEVSVEEEDVGDDDGYGKDPFCDFKRNRGLDLAGPIVEGEKIDGGEAVCEIDGARDDYENPEPDIGERSEAGGRPEIGKVLNSISLRVVPVGSLLTI
jgi:hypothetical protein